MNVRAHGDTAVWARLQSLQRDLREAGRLADREQVRALVNMYYDLQVARVGQGNRFQALKRGDQPSEVAEYFTKQVHVLEGQVKAVLGEWSLAHPVGQWLRSLVGVGPVIAAGMLAHIDITRAPTVGSIWRFAGLDPTSKWEKGQKRPWNADLKVLCCRPGSMVTTTAGPKRVEDVTVGDYVLTHRSRWRRVTRVFMNHHEGELVGLGTGTNRRTWLTPGHPVLAALRPLQWWTDRTREVRRFKAKGDVESKDWIAVQAVTPLARLARPGLPEGDTTGIDFGTLPGAVLTAQGEVYATGRWPGVPHALAKPLPEHVEVDAEIARWLGLYVAEGHVSGNTIGMSFHEDERDLIEHAQKGFARLGCETTCYPNEPQRSVQVIASRHLLAMWLSQHAGTNSFGAKVPDVIRHACSDTRDAFLHGVWLGDGDHREDEYIITTISLELARGLAEIDPSLTIHDAGTYYKLRRCSDSTVAARSVSESYEGPVYNLEVDEDHSYVVEGLAAHNCWKD